MTHGHLRGQRLVINYEDQERHEGHGGEGDEYIFGQGACKKGEDAEVLVSNHHPSYQRAANARPKPPSPVSCFILLTNALLPIGRIPLRAIHCFHDTFTISIAQRALPRRPLCSIILSLLATAKSFFVTFPFASDTKRSLPTHNHLCPSLIITISQRRFADVFCQSFFYSLTEPHNYFNTKSLIVMVTFSAAALFLTLRVLILSVSTSPVEAVPVTSNPTTHNKVASTSSSYWLANIQRQGTAAFGDSSYKVFRNVQDYGATGDGTTDDTANINAAISDGNRCGQGCDSSTVTPALIYFPPGTYLVSAPLIQYYYTQFVGDAVTLPTIKAAPSFTGIAVIDSDPYGSNGNWYTNQNNFFRQVRNFVIDIASSNANAAIQ